MQQFGPQFINSHLMPLFERMMTDAALDASKTYWGTVFLSKSLEQVPASELDRLMNDYFNPSFAGSGVPFVAPEEKKDREKLLKYFIGYMCSRANDTRDRANAFLPVKDQKSGAVTWPADVKRNLFLMCYNVAENFEHDVFTNAEHTGILDKLRATGNPKDVERADADAALLEKGQLMLVKGTTGEYDTYIRAGEPLKPGQAVIQFLPPPPEDMEAFMQQGFTIPGQPARDAVAAGGVTPQPIEKMIAGGKSVGPKDVVSGTADAESKEPVDKTKIPVGAVPDAKSSDKDLERSFDRKRADALSRRMDALGLKPIGPVRIDKNRNAFWTVKSGNNTLQVQVDLKKEEGEGKDLRINLTFQDGQLDGKSLAGKKLEILESQLGKAFKKDDGTQRTAADVFQDNDLRKTLGIGGDPYAPLAPKIPPKVPGLPVGGAGEVKGKLPDTVIPPGQPGLGVGLGGITGGAVLPTGPLGPPKPPPQMIAGGPGGAGGVTTKVGFKPVPGKPAAPGVPGPFPGVPAGSPLAGKIAQEQEGQPALAGAGGLPVAPGRVGGIVPIGAAGGEEKKGMGPLAKVALANGGALSGAGILTSLSGPGGPASPILTLKIMKGVLIAVAHYLPRLFG